MQWYICDTCVLYLNPELNECSARVHSCHSNATCENTHGSYSCACKAGFNGNGTHCQGEIIAQGKTAQRSMAGTQKCYPDRRLFFLFMFSVVVVDL